MTGALWSASFLLLDFQIPVLYFIQCIEFIDYCFIKNSMLYLVTSKIVTFLKKNPHKKNAFTVTK